MIRFVSFAYMHLTREKTTTIGFKYSIVGEREKERVGERQQNEQLQLTQNDFSGHTHTMTAGCGFLSLSLSRLQPKRTYPLPFRPGWLYTHKHTQISAGCFIVPPKAITLYDIASAQQLLL